MKELLWLVVGFGIAYVLWTVLRNRTIVTSPAVTTPVITSTPIITTTPSPFIRTSIL